jgi:5-guanidino-2-oxopentanoate decarboxylase
MLTSMSVGRALAVTLQESSIDTVFGIPGVHTLEYYRGFAETGIRTVLARHEGGAAFMADGYARACGRPAACCVITGPGLTNAATGIGQARSDSIPMVVLTSTTAAPTIGREWGLLHELPGQIDVLAQVTKRAHHAEDGRSAVLALHQLIGEATSGRPRPVGLQVPTDVLRSALPDSALDGLRPSQRAITSRSPSEAQIDRVLQSLRAATHPVLILGGGSARACTEVRELVDRIGIPVLTTTAGIGVVPEGHPLLAGALLSRRAAHEWLADRDLVLLLGTELSETDTAVPNLVLGGSVIHVDIDDAALAGPHCADLAIASDAREFAAALVSALGSGEESHRDSARTVADLRARAMTPVGETEAELVTMIDALRAGLPADAHVFADMTQLAYTGCWRFTADRPGRFLFPSGFGSLGYAVPAAIGGALADPSVRTCAVAGDGGLMYTGSELMTATELGLDLTVVVWDNAALGQIRDDMIGAGIPPISVNPQMPDLELLAQAHGFTYARAGDAAQLGELVAEPPAGRTVVHVSPRTHALNTDRLVS